MCAQPDIWRTQVNLARDWMFFAAIRHHVGWQEEQEQEGDGPCAANRNPFAR